MVIVRIYKNRINELIKTSFASVVNLYNIFVLEEKMKLTYIESNLFVCSQRPGTMVVMSLLQRLLEKIKQFEFTHFQD